MTDETDRHERNVDTVTTAVAQILDTFAPYGMTPEALIEGAMKAAATTAVRAGHDLDGAARLFEDFASTLRTAEGERDPTKPTVQ